MKLWIFPPGLLNLHEFEMLQVFFLHIMKRIYAFFGCCVVSLFTCLFAQSEHVGTSAGMKVVQADRQAFRLGAETYFSELTSGSKRRFEIAMNSIDFYLDFFASQHYETLPEWEKPIFDLVRQGQYEDAIARYEEQNPLKRFALGTLPYASVERYVMLLEMSGTRRNSLLGLEALQTVAELDTVAILPIVSLVNVALELHQQNVASEYLTTYQNQKSVSLQDRAASMSLRAKMLLRRNRPNEALAYSSRAVAIYDSLAALSGNPNFEVQHRARVHYVLANIYYRLDERALCVENVRKSREMLNRAVASDEKAYSIERIRTLFTMAPMVADMRDFFLADTLYTEVDSLGGWLYEGSRSQRQIQFNTLRMRGLCCFRIGKYEEARVFLDEADKVLTQMEESAPGQNLTHRQDLNFNMATLYYMEGDYEKALEINRKVLGLVQSNTSQESHRHSQSMASCYKYIGNCLWAIGYEKYVEANKRKNKDVLKYYQDAADSYATALQYNSRDNEAIAKYNLSDLIVSGMEKPMAMPAHF